MIVLLLGLLNGLVVGFLALVFLAPQSCVNFVDSIIPTHKEGLPERRPEIEKNDDVSAFGHYPQIRFAPMKICVIQQGQVKGILYIRLEAEVASEIDYKIAEKLFLRIMGELHSILYAASGERWVPGAPMYLEGWKDIVLEHLKRFIDVKEVSIRQWVYEARSAKESM